MDPPCAASLVPDRRDRRGLVAPRRDRRDPAQALHRGDAALERGDRDAARVRSARHRSARRRAEFLSDVRPVAYDHFYSYGELTETIRAWAEDAPGLCTLESIGTSFEGREIWLMTITNSETGAPLDKPAVLLEANIHSMEWTGTTAALHLIHKALHS